MSNVILSLEGTEFWYMNRKPYRNVTDDDGNILPSVIYSDGTQMWHHNGKLHRENDRPAVISLRAQEWWIRGARKREGGKPIIICWDGCINHF